VWLPAQDKTVWSDQEKLTFQQIRGLRQLNSKARAGVTRDLALKIRQLPAVPNKLRLAGGLRVFRRKAISGATHCRRSRPR
jgi:hypothetical protein